MPWIRKIYKDEQVTNLLENILQDLVTYVTDESIHGKDVWQLMRQKNWPYGTALKIHNQRENEYGYVALMLDNIRVGKSYSNWFRQQDVLRNTFVLNPNGLNFNDKSVYEINDLKVYEYSYQDVKIKVSDNPERYSINRQLVGNRYYYFSPLPDIFVKDADVLFFSTFKQYQPDFSFNELMGNTRKTIKAKPLKYYSNSSANYSLFDPPLYPGVGAPAIGFSPEFLSATDEAVVYIHKERHYADIAINIQERWEVATVGFFDAFDTVGEYAFPAMAVGGTSGVCPMTEVNSRYHTVEYYFGLDYTETNWALSHGVPSFASSYWDGTQKYLDEFLYSQVQAMLPDGEWQSFANFGIRQDYYYNYRWGMYYDGHKEPERIPDCKYLITPNFTDLANTTNLMPTMKNNRANTIDDIALRNKQKYQLEPLYLVQRAENNKNQNILGKIPSLYWCSQPVSRYGEYKVDGRTYLVVPNSWENRKYHIKHSFGDLLGNRHGDSDSYREALEYERLSRAMNCVIDLGE